MDKSFFNVEDVRLVKTNFLINEDFDSGNVNIDVDYNSYYAEADNGNFVKLRMDIEIFKHQQQDVPFEIEMTMEGIFSWNDDFQIENLQKFLAINGCAVLYSYARPIVTQLTTFAGKPPLILPLINFVKQVENENISKCLGEK